MEDGKAFEKVQDFVRDCVKQGLHTEVSFIEFRGIDREDCLRLAGKLGVKPENVHFRPLFFFDPEEFKSPWR